MHDDRSSTIFILCFLQHADEVDEFGGTAGGVVLQPAVVVVVPDSAALVDLGVGNGHLSHSVRRELAQVYQLNEHVPVLPDFIRRPITHALLLE